MDLALAVASAAFIFRNITVKVAHAIRIDAGYVPFSDTHYMGLSYAVILATRRNHASIVLAEAYPAVGRKKTALSDVLTGPNYQYSEDYH